MNRTSQDIRLADLWPAERGGRSPRSDAEREILRVAIEFFGLRGYGGTSTRAIARQAKVTAPLIGYHFGSKDGLFRACADVVLRSTTERLLAAPDDADLAGVVAHFARVHLEFARDHPAALRFVLSVVYGPEEGQPQVDVVEYWRPVVTWILRRIQRAVDSGEFVPRSGATAPRLMRYLFNIVHMEVMSSYEEQRFVSVDDALARVFHDGGVDVVDDLVAQFFEGAGSRHGQSVEEPK